MLFLSSSVFAGEADVVDVQAKKTGDGIYRFDVTVLHSDQGWDHYADKWEILASDGRILGTRTLYHPHVEEQPFTRSLSDIPIPEAIKTVTIRAHDSIHKYGGKTMEISVPR